VCIHYFGPLCIPAQPDNVARLGGVCPGEFCCTANFSNVILIIAYYKNRNLQ
jgi:hypothetical protein